MSDNEFDVIETILSGEPIPLTIGEQAWQLGDMRPLKLTRCAAQTLAWRQRDEGLYRAAGMADDRSARAWADLIAMYNAAQDTAYASRR